MKKYAILLIVILIQSVYAQTILAPRYADGDSSDVRTIYRGTTVTMLLETQALNYKFDWDNSNPIQAVLEDSSASHPDIPITINIVDYCLGGSDCMNITFTVPDSVRYGEWRFKVIGTTDPNMRYYPIAVVEKPLLVFNYQTDSLWFESIATPLQGQIGYFDLPVKYIDNNEIVTSGIIDGWTSLDLLSGNIWLVPTAQATNNPKVEIKHGSKMFIDIPRNNTIQIEPGPSYQFQKLYEAFDIPVNIINSPHFITKAEVEPGDSLLTIYFSEKIDTTYYSSGPLTLRNGAQSYSISNIQDRIIYIGDSTQVVIQMPQMVQGLSPSTWYLELDSLAFKTYPISGALSVYNAEVKYEDNFSVDTVYSNTTQLTSAYMSHDMYNITMFWDAPVVFDSLQGARLVARDSVGVAQKYIDLYTNLYNSTDPNLPYVGDSVQFYMSIMEIDSVINWEKEGYQVSMSIPYGQYRDSLTSSLIPAQEVPIVLLDDGMYLYAYDSVNVINSQYSSFLELDFTGYIGEPDNYMLAALVDSNGVINASDVYFHWTGVSWMMRIENIPDSGTVNLAIQITSPLDGTIKEHGLYFNIQSNVKPPLTLIDSRLTFDSILNTNIITYQYSHVVESKHLDVSLKAYDNEYLGVRYDSLQLMSLSVLIDSSKTIAMGLTAAQLYTINNWVTNGYTVVTEINRGFVASLESGVETKEDIIQLLPEDSIYIDPKLLGPHILQLPVTQLTGVIDFELFIQYGTQSSYLFKPIYFDSAYINLVDSITTSFKNIEMPYSLMGQTGQTSFKIVAGENMYYVFDTLDVTLEIFDPYFPGAYSLLTPSIGNLESNKDTVITVSVDTKYPLADLELIVVSSNGLIPAANRIITKSGYRTWDVLLTPVMSGEEVLVFELIHPVDGVYTSITQTITIAPQQTGFSIDSVARNMSYTDIQDVGISLSSEFSLELDLSDVTNMLTSNSVALASSIPSMWVLKIDPEMDEVGELVALLKVVDSNGIVVEEHFVHTSVAYNKSIVIEPFDNFLHPGQTQLVTIHTQPDFNLTAETGEPNVLPNSSINIFKQNDTQWILSITPEYGQWGNTDIIIRAFNGSPFEVEFENIAIEVANEVNVDLLYEPCVGLCLETVQFHYNAFNSKLSLFFNDVISIEQSGTVQFTSYIYDSKDDMVPDIGDQYELPITTTAIIAGTSIEYTLSEEQKRVIQNLDLNSDDLRVSVASGTVQGTSNGILNSGRLVPVHIDKGPKFQVYGAQYDPFDKEIRLKFDESIDDNLSITGSVIKIGLGSPPSSTIDIVINDYSIGRNDCVDDCNTSSELSIQLSDSDWNALEELAETSINNLFINIPNGTFTDISNQALEESAFNDNIPLSFGVGYGENWIENAIVDLVNGRVEITFNKSLESYQDRVLDIENGSQSTLMVIGVLDQQYDVSDRHPLVSQPNMVYVGSASDQVTYDAPLGKLFVELNDQNKAKIMSWISTYGTTLEGKAVVYFPHNTLGAPSGVKNPELTALASTGTITIPVEGSVIAAPDVKVETGEGIDYFVMEDQWKMFVTETAIAINPTSSVEENVEIGSRIYLQANKFYHVVAYEDAQYSEAVVVDASKYAALDLSVKQSGTAYRVSFVTRDNITMRNATFGMVLHRPGTLQEDTLQGIKDAHITSFGFDGDTIVVNAYLESLEEGDSTFIASFNKSKTFVLKLPQIKKSVPASEWNMISFGSTEKIVADLGAYTTVFWWDDSKLLDLLYGRYRSAEELSSIKPGQSVWIYSDVSQDIHQYFDTTEVSIELIAGDDGWNQLANPYGFNLAVEGFGNREFFKWNGVSYSKVNYLKPGEGYWSTVSENEVLTIERLPVWDTALSERNSEITFKKGAASRQLWDLGIALSLNNRGVVDQYNTIGVNPLADNKVDFLDKRELPQNMSDVPSLSMVIDGKRYRNDLKKPIDGAAEWVLAVDVPEGKGGVAHLQLDGYSSLKNLGYSLYLVDGSNAKKLESSKTELLLKGSTQYRLIVSENALNTNHLTRVPTLFNYPNPVRGDTRIMVQNLTMPGKTMVFKVMAVDGSVVYERVYSYQTSFTWNPVTMSGAPLKSGLYFYSVSTGAHFIQSTLLIME
ncbi:MAG: hypothetical protein OCC49_06790 [Fibrobacterales bacterium]